MRVLCLLDIKKLGIETNPLFDQSFFFVAISEPFSVASETVNTIADSLGGRLEHVPFMKTNENYCVADRVLIKKHDRNTFFKEMFILRLPTEIIVRVDELKSKNVSTKKGHIYLRAKVTLDKQRASSIATQLPTNEKLELIKGIHRALRYNGLMQSIYPSWYTLEIDRDKGSEDTGTQNSLFRRTQRNEVTEKEISELKKFLSSEIPLLALREEIYDMAHLLDARVVHERKIDTYSSEVILETVPRFSDGVAFRCFQKAHKDLRITHPHVIKALKNAFNPKEKPRNDLPSYREAQLIRHDEIFEKLSSIKKVKVNTLHELLTHSPLSAGFSPEIDAIFSGEHATEIMYLMLAYSIGGSQWYNTIGLFSYILQDS